MNTSLFELDGGHGQLVIVGRVGGGRELERRWDFLSGRSAGHNEPQLRRSPYQWNQGCSADGRVYASTQYHKRGAKPATCRLFAPQLPAEGVPLLPDVTDRSVDVLAVTADGNTFSRRRP